MNEVSKPIASRLTPELIGILGVGLALAGLMVTLFLDLGGRVAQLGQELGKTETQLHTERRQDIETLRDDLRRVDGIVSEMRQENETRLLAIQKDLDYVKEDSKKHEQLHAAL